MRLQSGNVVTSHDDMFGKAGEILSGLLTRQSEQIDTRHYMLYSRKAFTLMEVLVSVAVAGLVITAGFRLIAMSYKLMAELEGERQLINSAGEIWLRFRIDDEMPDNGHDDDNGIEWQTEHDSLKIDEYEFRYRRITISTPDNRTTVIYVAE